MNKSNIKQALMILPLLGMLAFLAADPSELMAYTLTGTSFAANTADFRINANFTDASAGSASEQIAALQAGAAEWKLNGGADYEFLYAGSTTSTTVAHDGVNSVFYSNLDGGGALATATWYYDPGGNTLGFDIQFYDRDGANDFVWAHTPTSGQFDMQSVVCHEFGHVLGLGHSAVAGATMFPSVASGTTNLRSIEADDISAIQAIYGLAPPPSPTVTSVGPANGWVDGGNTVTVTGSDFTGGTSVTIGGQSCTGVNVTSPTSLTLTVPAGTGQGTVDVTVTEGLNSDTLTGGYTFDTCRSLVGSVLGPGWNAFECRVPQDQGKFFRAIISMIAQDNPMSVIDPLDTRFFPLGWDFVFYYTLHASTIPLPYWKDTFGNLDASGTAIFKIWGLQDPVVSGLTIHTCFYVVSLGAPSNLSTISNRVSISFP